MIKVGLDIGNSKISCVVSDISTKNNLNQAAKYQADLQKKLVG